MTLTTDMGEGDGGREGRRVRALGGGACLAAACLGRVKILIRASRRLGVRVVASSTSCAHGPYRASHGHCVRCGRGGRGGQRGRDGPDGRGGRGRRRGHPCGGVRGGGGDGGAFRGACTWRPRRSQSSRTRRGALRVLPSALT